MTIIFALVGIPFALIGFYFLHNTYTFRKVAAPIDGMVFDNDISYKKDSKGNQSKHVYPIIDFYFSGDYYRFKADISDGKERKTGSIVTVLIKDNDPHTARLKTNARYMIGVVFALLGSIFTVVGIHEADFSFFTHMGRLGAFGLFFILFSVVPLFLIGYKIMQMKKKMNAAGIHSLDDLKREANIAKGSKVRKLTAEEMYQQTPAASAQKKSLSPQQQTKAARTAKGIGWLLRLVGLGMLAGSLYMGYNTYIFLQSAQTGWGQLVSYKENYDSENNSTTYCPVFTFTHPQSGNTNRYTDKLCSSSKKFSRGQQIPVLYAPDLSRVQVDSGWMNYFGAGILLILGGAFTLFSGLAINSGRKKDLQSKMAGIEQG